MRHVNYRYMPKVKRFHDVGQTVDEALIGSSPEHRKDLSLPGKQSEEMVLKGGLVAEVVRQMGRALRAMCLGETMSPDEMRAYLEALHHLTGALNAGTERSTLPPGKGKAEGEKEWWEIEAESEDDG